VLTEIEKLRSEFDRIASGSLARLDAAELLIVKSLFGLGLPVGSEASWSATVDFWAAAVSAAQSLMDPTYRLAQPGVEYELAQRPAEVRDRADLLTSEGSLAVPSILLQGGAGRDRALCLVCGLRGPRSGRGALRGPAGVHLP